MDVLVTLLGGSRGRKRFPGARYDHVRVRAPTMRCLSAGNAKGAVPQHSVRWQMVATLVVQ
ncbi:hypothetical protein BH11PSE5_BH11PSE5_08500 [soil metagenome]